MNNQNDLLFKNNNTGMIIGLITIVIFLVNSLLSVFLKDIFYLLQELLESYYANDVVNLIIITIVLIIFLIYHRLDNRAKVFLLPGILLFILYNCISYLISIKTIQAILLNSILIALSIISLSLIFHDAKTISGYNKISVIKIRIIGGILLFFAIIFLVRATNNIINVINIKKSLTLVEISVNISDLIICSFWGVSSILLILRIKIGEILSFASYFQGTLLFVGLILYLILKPIFNNSNIVVKDIIVIFTMALIFIVPFIVFSVKLIGKSKNESITN